MGIRILDGLSSWVREQVGPEADNRGEAANDAGEADDSEVDTEEADSEDADADDTDTADSDSDAPACCSAAGNTDITVFDT